MVLFRHVISFAIVFLGVFLFAGESGYVHAQSDFVPIVDIPFIDTGGEQGLPEYVQSLYIAAISIAGFLAVIRIIFAGFQYMLTDIVTQKSDARKSIKNALLGLLLVIGAILILNTINPSLTNITALSGLQALTPEDSSITINYNAQEPTYAGPDSCGTGESLVQSTIDDQIVRRCVQVEDNPNIDLPDEDDLEDNETLFQEQIAIPCIPNAPGGGCYSVNQSDNINGLNQAVAECDNISNGRGEFTPLTVTQGICSWTELD